VSDPLQLAPLFEGGAVWEPLLRPTLEALKDAETFIGPQRDKGIVPVRELTFQALKPNPPERWKVVIFGQNPYPRVESATGIAMFDNAFGDWQDAQFGKVTSIRCIIKAAAMWKHGIEKQTSTAVIRGLLQKHDVVAPPEWFQAMLTQGALLLNAALTASSDDALSTSKHTSFWKPVVERIVDAILAAKEAADPAHRGVVFAWWGSHAKALRALVEKLQKRYPGVEVRHVDHCNPAAMGDAFCDGAHFSDINDALTSLGQEPIDWLPSKGWNAGAAHAAGMGEFIAKTMELHKLYLDRLQGVADEKLEELPAIAGILDRPVMSFSAAVEPLVTLMPQLAYSVKRANDFADKATSDLTRDEVAALYLYTAESDLYRKLNATLRDPDRSKVAAYFGYLRLFLKALARLQRNDASLWRGVAKDLRKEYALGRTVTWWGVSSCTSKLQVAKGFLGSKGKRMLFEVKPRSAVSIKPFSAFTGEEEYVLAPGTQLKVLSVMSEADGLVTVQLEELADAPRVG
jgi:uracil DNA glycosylase